MSFQHWLDYLGSAQKRSHMNGPNRRVFYKFPDGKEMAEEYSVETGVVIRRAWRKSKQLMGEPVWETEIGEEYTPINNSAGPSAGAGDNIYNQIADDGFALRESNTAPILTKRVTKRNLEWRIRNLPYPISVYKVRSDIEKRSIIVSTTIKKYYKVIHVPELDRCNIAPLQENISVHHQYNTLIITYKKPKILCDMEEAVLKMLNSVETESDIGDILQGLMKKV